MEVILSTNRTGVDYYFDSQIDSSEGGMGPYWAIHWGSGIIKRLRTPALDGLPGIVCITDDFVIHGHTREEH